MTFPSGFGRQANNPATVSTAGSVYLSAASNGYQSITTTALGQSVYEEDATKLPVLGTTSPVTRIIKNDGGYPIGYRDYTGTLIMGIAAGGILYATLRDNSTPAGSWSVTGTNLEPGLITIDNTFSSTYASTVLAPFVALDVNKSIHFAALASGFAAFAVDKLTGAVGTPVTVSATASMVPRTVFMITATTAMLFYSADTGTLIGVVLSLSGATTLAVGTPSSTLTATGAGVENFSGAPKIAQLDTNLFLVSYATATGAGTTSVAAFQVSSGTTATLGSAANIIAANNIQDSTTTRTLTTLTALVNYKSGAAAPYTNSAVVVSVTNANPPVCTVATPVALTGCATNTGAAGYAAASVLLSPTKCLVCDDNNASNLVVSTFTIAGTVITAGTAFTVEAGLANGSVYYTANSATRYNPHLFPLSTTTALLWYFDSSGISRAVVLTESAGVVTAGTILYRSISSGSFGGILPQGVAEFCAISMQVPAANGFYLGVTTCKISGSVITQGNGMPLRNIAPNYGYSIPVSKLSSGDYVLLPSSYQSLYPTSNVIPVFRSNGDALNYRGEISCPSIRVPGGPLSTSLSANRLVVIGSDEIGTTVGTTTYQLRLLNIEIAA